jgi:hypothetical protein
VQEDPAGGTGRSSLHCCQHQRLLLHRRYLHIETGKTDLHATSQPQVSRTPQLLRLSRLRRTGADGLLAVAAEVRPVVHRGRELPAVHSEVIRTRHLLQMTAAISETSDTTLTAPMEILLCHEATPLTYLRLGPLCPLRLLPARAEDSGRIPRRGPEEISQACHFAAAASPAALQKLL